jgi:hypothetical protein
MAHEWVYYPSAKDEPRSRLLTEGEFKPSLKLGVDMEATLRFEDREAAIKYLSRLGTEALALAEMLRRGAGR